MAGRAIASVLEARILDGRTDLDGEDDVDKTFCNGREGRMRGYQQCRNGIELRTMDVMVQALPSS